MPLGLVYLEKLCNHAPLTFRWLGLQTTFRSSQVSYWGSGLFALSKVGVGQAHTLSILDMGPFGPKPEPPQPVGMHRPRYHGSDEELLTALRPFVTRASFFKYGEKHNCQLKADVLVAHAPLFRELTKLSANLAFKKGSLQAVLLRLAHENKFPSLSVQASLDDWVETMDARLRIACRHVAKARIQPAPPRWLQHIDGDSMAALADSGREVQDLELPGVMAVADSGREGQESEGPEAEDSAAEQRTLPSAMPPAAGIGDEGDAADEPPDCPKAPVTHYYQQHQQQQRQQQQQQHQQTQQCQWQQQRHRQRQQQHQRQQQKQQQWQRQRQN